MVSPLRSSGCPDPRWLKKGSCPLILSDRRAVRVFATDILQQIAIIYSFKSVLETPGLKRLKTIIWQNMIYAIQKINHLVNADFKGLFLIFHENRGL